MNHSGQQNSFDARTAERIDLSAALPEGRAARPSEVETVEYGSGWYHDAAIVASEPAPARKH